MFLKLESTSSGSRRRLCPPFSDPTFRFMVWNSVETLHGGGNPSLRLVHHSAILLLPPCWRSVSATRFFANESAVCTFQLFTLSLSAIMSIMIIGQQGVTGGVNGINDFRISWGST